MATFFPQMEDLNDEQRACFLQELGEERALVTSGPPGTGKTVIVFYRALKILNMDRSTKATIIMFNRVLQSLVEEFGDEIRERADLNTQKDKKKIQVKTFHVWLTGQLMHWTFKGFHPEKKGLFSRYEIVKGMSKEVGKGKFNWESIRTRLSEELKAGSKVRSWSHLIVDEGQDQPKAFYQLARKVIREAKKGNMEFPSLLVCADEAQTITEENSTLEEICSVLHCSIEPDGETHHRLEENFRNTLQIARFAAAFSTDSSTDVANLPDGRDKGEIPRVKRYDSLDDSVDSVVRYALQNPNQTLGVFAPRIDLLKNYRQRLNDKLNREKPPVPVVQIYYSGEGLSAEDLKWGEGGHITLLTDKSSKGLEFDAVFVIQLEERRVDASAEFRKQMFVLLSRAREILNVHAISNEGSPEPGAWTEIYGETKKYAEKNEMKPEDIAVWEWKE